jgi:hypothetical protein
VRSPPKSRPLRPQPAREINTIAQPQHTPLRTHTTRLAHTSQWTRRGTRTRARRSTPRSTSSPTSLQPKDTNPPQVCPPARPAATHAAQLRSALPLRAQGRCACCRRTRTRLRGRAMSAPAPARLRRLRARREARRHLCWPVTCERAASPVLLTACALLPRCRQPQVRAVGLDGHRALDISATTGRRDVDTTVTRILAVVTPAGSAAWPRRRGACACESCSCEPGTVFLEAAAPSAHCSTHSPSSTAPSTPSWSSAP